jgi:hypothetical protein
MEKSCLGRRTVLVRWTVKLREIQMEVTEMRFLPIYCAAVLLLCGGCGPKHAITSVGSSEQPAPPTDATGERIKTLLAHINDEPDKLHADYTPAVHELIKVGEPALTLTLELMLADGLDTRLRAQRVLEGVTLVQHGFVLGQGWKEDGGEKRFRKFWSELGDLAYDSSPEKRAASVTLWKKWLAGRAKSLSSK